MITEFFEQFYSSGDGDELVQLRINTAYLSKNTKIEFSDGNTSTIHMTIADFEKIQSLIKAYQDACDVITAANSWSDQK